ncbi:MAG: M20 metallopeptidase family protein [Planctomycetota bacterium]|jgi:amidohydrolase
MQKPLRLASAVLLASVFAGLTAAADEIADRVERSTRKITPAVVELRRDIHAHPELPNREERTGRVVAERLGQIGVDEIQTGVAHHGVVGLIRGKRPGVTVALRADFDALPILEQTGLPFASRNEGVMHACGHDAHTAMLLGAAEVLVQMRDAMPGNVKLIFQPAEEGAPPGEQGGARLMIEEGVLDHPKVEAIFGMHVSSDLEAGTLAYRAGALLASVDRFRITVTGKQSHAAMPWKGTDPILASAHLITAAQTIASRTIDARDPVVVSFGIIRAGTAWNIIPGQVELEGTIRTHEVEVRRRAVEQFHRIARHTAEALGTKVDVEFDDYGPVVWNDPELTGKTRRSLQRAAGESHVEEAQPVMGGEDFAHYAAKVPGCFVFIGVRNEAEGIVHAVHTPQFTIDEAALPVGVRAHCLMALDYLAGRSDDTPDEKNGSPEE